MNKTLAAVICATMLVSASPIAMAGGPVIVEDSVEVVADKPASSLGILPVIVVAVALCAALCGNDDPEPQACAAAEKC